jgi:uncharacterized protein (TIGR02996 family)
MSDDAPFLQAVLADPDDDGCRLVYADWLEERGDPRGELIRVQVELARLPAADARRPELQDRERRLLAQHQAAWAEPLRGLVRKWTFRRGFIEQVTVEAEQFLAGADRLFRLAPVRHVRFQNAAGSLNALAACPDLARLATLDLRENALQDEHLEVLTASPHLVRLANLRLGFNHLGDGAAHFLATFFFLGSLATLDLYGNEIGPQGAQSLASSAHLSGLRTLILGSNDLGDAGVAELAAGRGLGRLNTLHLGFTQLTDGGARALADAPRLTELTTLDLSYNAVSDGGVRRLATTPQLPRLARLALRGTRLGPRVRKVLQARFGAGVSW